MENGNQNKKYQLAIKLFAAKCIELRCDYKLEKSYLRLNQGSRCSQLFYLC